MTTQNPPEGAVSLTFHFDRHDWGYADKARAFLTEESDQELFDLCAAGGAKLYPYALIEYMTETLEHTPEVLNASQWRAATEAIKEHAADAPVNPFDGFAHLVEDHLASRGVTHENGQRIDMLDSSGHGTVSDEFELANALYWLDGDESLEAMTYHYDGISACARLTMTGPGIEEVLELHFAKSAARDGLARFHLDNFTGNDGLIIADLNDYDDDHIVALVEAAYVHPGLDIHQLNALLAS